MNLTANNDMPPMRISEIVLKTMRFAEMRDWYLCVLGIEPFYQRGRPEKPSWTGALAIAFFRMHIEFPYTQVLGIFEVEGTADAPGNDPGSHHHQFRHACLEDLFDRYEKLSAMGITPIQTWNHGPSTSFYYQDPDGNRIEMSGSNYETEAEYMGYFETDAYKTNISGIEVDVEDYVGRFRAGTPKAELIKIPA